MATRSRAWRFTTGSAVSGYKGADPLARPPHHSNGISARQLIKQAGLGAYRSAWMLCHKLRRAMVDPDRSLLSGWVEVDETLVPYRTKPYRTKNDSIAGSRSRSHDARMA